MQASAPAILEQKRFSLKPPRAAAGGAWRRPKGLLVYRSDLVEVSVNGAVILGLGTGKEQSITITASTNMSKDDIDKAVKDAEQYAAEDKKRREEVDVRNNADQMVFQTEKALGEFGDKVSASEKSEVETKLSALKEALKSGTVDDIKAKQDDLQKAFYAISEKVYQQAAQAQGQQPGAQPGNDAGAQPKDDGAVDADFHEV